MRMNLLGILTGSPWPNHWKYVFRQTIHEIWIDLVHRLPDNLLWFNLQHLASRSLRISLETLIAWYCET